MSNNSGVLGFGKLVVLSYECDVITWKIPNVTSIEITENTEFQSPCFWYKEATWILKLNPCGAEGPFGLDIQVQIERLHSEIPEHSFTCTSFFENHDKMYEKHLCKPLEFNLNHAKQKLWETEEYDWNFTFYHQSGYRHDDMITFVVEILTKEKRAIGLDSEANLAKASLGLKFTGNEVSLKSIGELFTESFDVAAVAWKIPRTDFIPDEVDNKVTSPVFSVFGASWIFNLFLHGQMKFKSEQRVDVMIERQQSQIQKHPVFYKFFIGHDTEKKFFLKFYTEEMFSYPVNVRGFFIFDADHTQENFIEIMSYCDLRSIEELGSAVLASEFKSPKKSEIRLMESMQSAIHFPCLMYENIEMPEVGEIIKKPYECKVISWTIPNGSSLLNGKNDVAQSPSFSYKGATWNLKMYPHAHTPSNTKHYLEVAIQRCHSQIPAHNMHCRIYFKGQIDKASEVVRSSIVFDSSHEQWNFSWKCLDIFYFYKRYRHNDAFTLICEIYTKKDSVINSFKTQSSEAVLGGKSTTSENSCKSVGELFTESFDGEVITWKIPKQLPMPAEADKGVQSSLFPFADTSWILKMFPDGQTKFRSQDTVDFVIEMMHSRLSKHPVTYRLYLDDYDKKFDENGYSIENFREDDGKMYDIESYRKGSFIFDTNHPQENICNVIASTDLFNSVESNRLCDSVFLVCDFRSKKNTGNGFDMQKTSFQQTTCSSQETTEEETASCATPSKGSTQETTEEETASFSTPSNGSSQETTEEETASFSTPSKESSQETTEEETRSFSTPSKRFQTGTKRSFDTPQSALKSLFGTSKSAEKPLFGLFDTSRTSAGSPSKCNANQGSSQETMKEESASFATSSKGSSQETMKEEPTSSFGSPSKGSSQETMKEEPTSSFGSPSKGPSIETKKEEPASFGSLSKGSSIETTEEETASFGTSSKVNDKKSESSLMLQKNKVLRDLKDLFMKQEDCDVTFKVKEQEFSAHRVILKARSPVLVSTFRNELKEKATGVIDVEGCDPSHFFYFLNFLYCGEVEMLTVENVFSLHTLADKYDVTDLKDNCIEFIKHNLSIETFCDTTALALLHSDAELIKLSIDFFAKNLKKIIVTVKWQSFIVENPIQCNELLIKALVLDNE